MKIQMSLLVQIQVKDNFASKASALRQKSKRVDRQEVESSLAIPRKRSANIVTIVDMNSVRC